MTHQPWPTPEQLARLRSMRMAGILPRLLDQLAEQLGCVPPRVQPIRVDESRRERRLAR